MFDGIKEWLASKGIKAIIPSVVRLLMGALAGWLLSKGFGEAAHQVEAAIPGAVEVVTGIATAAVAVIWSLLEKSKNVPTTPKVILESRGVEYASPTKKV